MLKSKPFYFNCQ